MTIINKPCICKGSQGLTWKHSKKRCYLKTVLPYCFHDDSSWCTDKCPKRTTGDKMAKVQKAVKAGDDKLLATKRRHKEAFNDHEGLSWNQVLIILNFFKLDSNEFGNWMYGQTCPMVPRNDTKGVCKTVLGYYEYDVFRWINYKLSGTPLIWD